MKLLVIGYGSLVERRVLPAVTQLPEIDSIHIASRRKLAADVIPECKRGQTWLGYDRGLSGCPAGLAYISLPNSLHAQWAERALEAGFHVIIDKPAVTDLQDAFRLVKVADAKKLCLAEANVWLSHPMSDAVRDQIRNPADQLLHAAVIFASPPLESDNFRYRAEMGGGVLLDRGSYAISCGRLVFGGMPMEVDCWTVFGDHHEVDTSATVVLRYQGGRTLSGFFSLESEYRNSLTLIASSYSLDTDRIFSPPDNYEGVIRVRRQDKVREVKTRPQSSFERFVREVIVSIKEGSQMEYSRNLLADAEVMDALRRHAGENIDDH